MRVIAVLVLCLVLCDAIDIQSLQRRRRGSEKEIEVAVGGQTVKCPFSVDSVSLDKVVKVDDAPDLKATVKIGDATINIRECAMDDSDKGGFILNCGGSKTKWTAAPVSSKASDVTKSECDHVISALAAITQTYRYELSKANPISLPLATRQSMIDALPGVTIDAIRGAVSLVPATASDLQKQDQDLVDAVIALITQGQPTSNLAPWKLQLFFDKQKTLTVYEYDGKETTYKDTTKSDKQQLDHRVAIENAITNVPYERNGFASAYEKARRPIYTAQNFDAVANGAYPNYGDCAIHLKPSVLLRSILYTDNTLMYGTYLYLKANMKDKLKLPDPDKFDALMTALKDLGGDQSVGTLRSWYVQQSEMKKKIGFVPSMLFDLKVADQLKLARTALLEYARTFPDDLVKKSKKQSDLGHHVPEVLVYGGVLARDIDKITCKKTDETKAFEKLAGVAKIQFSFI